MKTKTVSKNEVLKLINAYLSGKTKWNDVHYWFLNLTSHYDDIIYEAPYEDVLDDLETIFLTDENDAEEFKTSDEEIIEQLNKISKIEEMVKKEGIKKIAKKFEEGRVLAEKQRILKFKARHKRKQKN